MPGAAEVPAAGGTPDVNPTPVPMDDAGVGGAPGASSPDEPLGMLAVEQLTIEPNPQMSLGCYVSWTTSEPAHSEVQFGVGGYELRIVDSELVTEHRVHVVGMHAETSYAIRAVSTNETATGSADGDFSTGALPENMPAQATLVAEQFDAMQPGWTLTNVQVGADGAVSNSNLPGMAVIVDELGQIVWYFVQGPGADSAGTLTALMLANGNVLLGNTSGEPAREVDLMGNVLWEGPTGGSGTLSHHTSKLSNGNYIVVRESSQTARVEELSPDNDVVWSWDLYEHIEPPGTNDWCHLNAVTFDEAEEYVYLNCRYQGLFKAERSSGDLLWHMGAAMHDSESGDITYLPDNSVRYNDAHDPEVHADGTILFYDNQGWERYQAGEANGNFHSRVIEYQVDEDALTATVAWEFPGEFDTDAWYVDDWQTQIWGDADRLDNGNVLVTAGVRGVGTNTRIFEVTRDGQVVWGMEWPDNHGSYRAERIAALADPI